MKGSIFRAFESFMEAFWSENDADDALSQPLLASGGAYTSVGDYPHGELMLLIQKVGLRAGLSDEDILRKFGAFLFSDLAAQSHVDLSGYLTCFDLLDDIESVIHRDIRRLNRHAEIPVITTRERNADQRIVLHYESDRPFAHLAEGLIHGALGHFGLSERAKLAVRSRAPDNTSALFEIEIETNDTR
jgi:hypothetical protein